MSRRFRIGVRLVGGLIVLSLALAVPPLEASAGQSRPPTVKPPKSGQYNGTAGVRRKLTLWVSGRDVTIVAFDFTCGQTVGRISLNDLRLRRTPLGYRFILRAHGSVTYRDGQPDENARAYIQGRFTRSGRTVRGTLRVVPPRCRNTRLVRWSAQRS
jgi:hypothetical protein